MIQIKSSHYPYRYEARLIVEANTPLAIGSGEGNMMTDRLVIRDVNGLPFLPGSTISGVLRHAMEAVSPSQTNLFFGEQKKRQSFGSRLLISEGRVVAADGSVLDGMQKIDTHNEYYNFICETLIRQHVRIDAYGVAEKHGKFDEEIVPKGVRFCFEIEMLAEKTDDMKFFEQVLNQVNTQGFRLGGGTRNGLGEIKVISVQKVVLDLRIEEQRKSYLSKPADLAKSAAWPAWQNIETPAIESSYDEYVLSLQPKDFYIFGSGLGDDETDDAPLKERFLKWDETGARIVEASKVVPASSLKGIISHRVAYYYNKDNKLFASETKTDEAKGMEPKTGCDNKAVAALFGSQGDSDGNGRSRGKVIFSDLIEEMPCETKVFNHGSISQFTGGAMAGKLYDEKVIYAPESTFLLRVLVPKTGLEEEAVNPLIHALKDVCKGMLPIGGMTNRGHGVFTGSLTCNGKEVSL